MKYKTLIFDFDGTIADSFGTVLKTVNSLAEELGYQKIEYDQAVKLKDYGAREIIKQTKISVLKVPQMARRVRAELNKEVKSLKPFPAIKEMLSQLHQKGYQLIILSSNSLENVQDFLDHNHIKNFDEIYSEDNIFGKHKVINHLLKKFNLKKEQVLYIGDEVRDIEACQKSGIAIAAVTWGYNSKQSLQKKQPDYLVNKPEDLINIS